VTANFQVARRGSAPDSANTKFVAATENQPAI
jgi:hypothetical protein